MTTAKEHEEPSVRHRRHPLAFALVAGALLTQPLYAGWRSVGPYGGTITVVAVDGLPVVLQPLADPYLLAVSPAPPYKVYLSALDETELFESTDAGASWVPIGPFFRQLVPDPASANVLYGLDYFSHLLKSTDGGLSFAGTPAGGLLFGTLVRDPVTPSRLYAGLLGEGKIITSDDDFATSQQIGADIIGQPSALAIDPDLPGRLWAGSQYAVFVFDPVRRLGRSCGHHD